MVASIETKVAVKQILLDLAPYLDEKQKRVLYGSAASVLGHGGITFVNEITGSARNTIVAGMNEITSPVENKSSQDGRTDRVRKPGAGRKSALEKNPLLYEKIEEIITQNGDTYGNPEKPLRWTTWSLRKIASELVKFGITVSQNIVSRALDALGYSKQQNQKMYQVGEQHPDRDAQFCFINETSAEFLSQGEPVISIDTKKKENVGKWRCVGKNTFPEAKRLYITCDSGGSNGCRIWLWKHYVQQLANETQMEIHVSHFPTGTSKWNKIEHRLFCYISKNWQGRPLIDVETIVNLIGSTTTEKGLSVTCHVDENHYELGKKITAEQKENINIEFVGPNEKWNYIIRPNR